MSKKSLQGRRTALDTRNYVELDGLFNKSSYSLFLSVCECHL